MSYIFNSATSGLSDDTIFLQSDGEPVCQTYLSQPLLASAMTHHVTKKKKNAAKVKGPSINIFRRTGHVVLAAIFV